MNSLWRYEQDDYVSQFFQIHPENPQPRLIRQAVEIIRKGGVVVYPTDSAYALGCQIGDKTAIERVRRLRQLDEKHNFALICSDLSQLGNYAKIDTGTFRIEHDLNDNLTLSNSFRLVRTTLDYIVTNPDDIPRTIAEAFHIARTGRPDPVLVDIAKSAMQSLPP